MKRTYIIPQITFNSMEVQSSIMAGSVTVGGLLVGGNTEDIGTIPHGD